MSIFDEKESRKIVLEDMNFSSNRMSELTRYIGFGSLALVFAVLTSNSTFAQSMVNEGKLQLLAIGALGAITIFIDYMHYFSSYMQSRLVLNNTESFSYDDIPILKGVRIGLFWLKQFIAIISVMLVFYLIVRQAVE